MTRQRGSGDTLKRREVAPGVYQCGCRWIRAEDDCKAFEAGVRGDVLKLCPIHEQWTKERERARLGKEIDSLVALGRARMPAQGNPLYPCETDWLSPEELAALQALQLRLTLLQDTTAEIRARVAAKRKARQTSPR